MAHYGLLLDGWVFYKTDFTIQNPFSSSFHGKMIIFQNKTHIITSKNMFYTL
jgi:hypothetical protein